MSKNLKIALFIGGALVIGAGTWFLVDALKGGGKASNRSEAMDIFAKLKPSASKSLLKSADEGYVVQWANALLKGNKEFTFDGKKYSSKTGRAV